MGSVTLGPSLLARPYIKIARGTGAFIWGAEISIIGAMRGSYSSVLIVWSARKESRILIIFKIDQDKNKHDFLIEIFIKK